MTEGSKLHIKFLSNYICRIMAVSLVRRKRIIAVIFAVCVITALFLYRKGVRETWDGGEIGGTGFSRFDLSNAPATKVTTNPLPTKMYSVIELEDEETMETAEDKDEGTEQDGSEMKVQENEIEETFWGTGRVRTDDNRMETGGAMNHKEKIKNVEMEERIASNERRAEGGVDNKDKTAGVVQVETEMRNIEVEKKARGQLEQMTENEDREFKKGKKHVQENKIENVKKDDRQDDMKKSTEDEEATEERKNRPSRNRSRGRDKPRMRDESRMREESRTRDGMRDERVHSVHIHDGGIQSNTGSVRLAAKPIGPLSPLVLKSLTVKSKPTRQVKVTLVPSFRTRASTATRSTATTTIPNARTRKTNWVNKSTEMNSPRPPRKKSETNPPAVRQSTRLPGTSAAKETPVCKIPALDPFHPHVVRLQNNVGTNLRKICRSMYPYAPVFKVVNNKLVLKTNVKEADIVKSSIKLQKIRRLDDEDFKYTKVIDPFNGLPNLYESNDIGQSDFFRLEYKIDGRYASDLYARVSPKLDVVERQTKIARKFQEKGLPLNVLIIGVDSVSRANFVRKLPRVKSFLETELNTYFMEGMSIVGDATTPILTAMFTGKDDTVLPEGRTSFGGRPIDNWPWIMKDYERQGYMTLYAEDDPSVSAFNLRLRGFSKSPTHHYMRPFWQSLESENERDEPGRCSKSESMVNHTLKYIKSFFDVYPTSRKFAFAFHSYLAHAHPNHLSLAEEDLMWFLRTFVDRGYLKDTMLIIMGDHGSRNGEYRETIQGKLEERLPWFSISLPFDFHRTFSNLTANLRNNQAIITSSFDVHATLRHILTYPSFPSGEQTRSLFEKLSRNRTCKDAGIAEHWCPCFQWSPIDVNSKHVQSIAVSAVELVNTKLSQFPLLNRSCHKLSLENVLHAITLQPNRKVQTFYSTDQDGGRGVNYAGRTRDLLRYQIIFTTQPNQAKYEVTAHVRSNQVTVNPEISRLNRYNDQPACIAKQYPHARKFCFCRTSSA